MKKRILALTIIFTMILSMFVVAADVYTVKYKGTEWEFFEYLMEYPEYKAAVEEISRRAEAGDFKDEVDFYEACNEVDLLGMELEDANTPSYSEIVQNHTLAECEFDAETGTVLKILNDAKAMYIPEEINGVEVVDYAPYIAENKTKLEYLNLPPTITRLDETVARNCPNLKSVDSFVPEAETYLYENCPSAYWEYVELDDALVLHTVNSFTGNVIKVDRAAGFAVASKTIIGNGSSGYDWYGNLTRAQATVIIIRLMGLAEEAEAYKSIPSEFTDVPEWALGYVNLAVEKGIVKGIGAGKFGSDLPCGMKDFVTMLFRLTELTEGEDYSWSTAISDIKEVALELENMEEDNNKYVPGYFYQSVIEEIAENEYRGGAFTRGAAVRCIYVMMNSVAGENDKSLGDILVEKYGMSDYLMYNQYIRRTGKDGFVKDIDPALLHALLDENKHREILRAEKSNRRISDEVKTLAAEITEGIEGDYEKTEAICEWVATHIFYDYDTYMHGAKNLQDAASVLANRFAICAGYSNLTANLLNAAGIESYYEESDSHAWNVAFIDGKRVFIDNTWDSQLRYEYGVYCDQNGKEIKDIMNPGVSWRRINFDLDAQEFLCLHKKVRMPNRNVME